MRMDFLAGGQRNMCREPGKEPKESQPVSYDREPDFEDFGLGCFLLAGTEIYKLKK
jgi:unsaturated rhamnogalacturonyl hydrolase